MSRGRLVSGARHGGFPRVSGDEPNYGQRLHVVQTFSPRERG